MSENAEEKCQQCGATLLPKWRFCVVCSATVPNAARQPHDRVSESLRHLPSTRQPDKTLVFVPELRQARLKRTRRNKWIIVISVIGCLALAIAGYAFLRSKEQKKTEAPNQKREIMARRDLDLYANAFKSFYADAGRYPTVQEGLSALLKRPSALASWRGPYIEADYSVDPWGHDYVYQAFNNGATYSLSSYGPEGEGAGRFFLRITAEAAEPHLLPTP
jgi:general secretion pathway protein G